MLVQLNTSAVATRQALEERLAPFPAYREEILKDFDSMLLGLPTPFFDRCEAVRKIVLEALVYHRNRHR